MSESDLNTYKLQLQQVEAALTTDPDNEELNQLKNDLEQVLNLTLDLINAQLGQGTSTDDDLENALKKEKPKKSRWAEPDPILPVKPWQVGEHCQAIYPVDSVYYDAKIEEITTDGEVSVKFKGYKGSYVTTIGLLRLPSSGTTTVHATGSAKNKKELANYQRELKKEKKKKNAEKMKDLEEEREKEKMKWSSFSAKAFGKKGFVKKSIFKTPETADGKVGVGTCGISGQKMTDFSSAAKYRKGQ
eukprot:TRINITY_DN74366_c0_g1_i1.p1 TRINITY_DN74366_c0_g1~~TRINITY_DN74366_c0_g1_i1.p1  ORF type:complete len:245 (-),score=94.37 TRINITY_DN74366_c0_g1_i1:82-816(-)